MKIRYSEKVTARTFGDAPCHFKTDQAVTYLPREACIMAGFTDKELDRAEAAPGTWIEREREEALPPSVRTESEVIADLTEQRDKLLEACKDNARTVAELLQNFAPHLPPTPRGLSRSTLTQLSFTIEVSHSWLESMSETIRCAIALAEPKP